MNAPVTISTFYSFVDLPDPKSLRAPILERMQALGIRGTITLAREGVNATVSGADEAIDALMGYIGTLFPFTTPTRRESHFGAQPFKRTKVKVKRELISIGVPTFPAQCVGQYVQPADWNALISAPDVITIDTRNAYEFDLGHFEGAVNPATRNFKQMVKWTAENLVAVAPPLRGSQIVLHDLVGGNNAENHPPTETLKERFDSPSRGELPRTPRIAMYCTGGIRCEKYSSYLVSLGFTEVYHLFGGILAYLERIPESESLWHGNCFVFDERVAVGHGLVPAKSAVI